VAIRPGGVEVRVVERPDGGPHPGVDVTAHLYHPRLRGQLLDELQVLQGHGDVEEAPFLREGVHRVREGVGIAKPQSPAGARPEDGRLVQAAPLVEHHLGPWRGRSLRRRIHPHHDLGNTPSGVHPPGIVFHLGAAHASYRSVGDQFLRHGPVSEPTDPARHAPFRQARGSSRPRGGGGQGESRIGGRLRASAPRRRAEKHNEGKTEDSGHLCYLAMPKRALARKEVAVRRPPVQDKLMALAELQKLDLESAALRKAAEVYPRQMAELERELGVARGAVEAERARLLDVDRQRRTLEQNISDEKEKVKKWEGRLAEQRSTREYAALAREIDIAKKANLTMAEELVELGKGMAALRETVKVKEQEHLTRVDQVAGRLAELRRQTESFTAQVKGIDSQRASAAAQVHPPLLQRYETVRRRRMPALVTVVAGTCQGCNMNVPPQLYNTLKTTLGTDICPSCHRIICAPEAIEPPAARAPAAKG
jgi:predicted  nucleic acid-binding Zn-ribbon protein